MILNPYVFGGGNDGNTRALLHMDGSNGSTTFTNSAVGGSSAWTAHGTAQLSTTSPQFGTACGLFVAGDYVDSPASSDFNFAGNFCIDFWYRPTSTLNTTIFRCVSTTDWNTCTANDYILYRDGARNLTFDVKGVASWGTGVMLADDTYVFIVIERVGTALTIYTDGVARVVTATAVTLGNTKAFEIGRAQTNLTASGIVGRVDEFRISGAERFNGAHSVPTAAYF